MAKPKTYRILGLMSGTSLDGLDLALVEFTGGKRWHFNMIASSTHAYTNSWGKKLASAHTLTGADLLALHVTYGTYLGKQCQVFLRKNRIRTIDAIASHGHTIFHQPDRGFTFQLGDGKAMHAATGLKVISDFRSLDVLLGGEGAPLVPVGDRLLFPQYEVCLNLGGIANLSMEIRGERKAFDVCFCNMALNYLMKEIGKSFDRDGTAASRGEIDNSLLKSLSKAYRAIRKQRKSIGREFFEEAMEPLLENRNLPLANRLRTVVESVAIEIANALPVSKSSLTILTTGGGALNRFLVAVLQEKLNGKAVVVLPEREIIEFKEALIFAFLGMLRLRGEVNVLKSVTRARRDSCSGVVTG